MSGSKAKASRLQSQQSLIRASIASLQSVELRERIVNYLDKNPEMLAPCWHALEKGLFDPNMTQVDKLKFWLPESNTRIKHVARYFLEECLEKMDPRFTDEVCGKLGVGGDSKTIFQLFYFATRLQELSVVLTRHRRSFMELVVARHKAQFAQRIAAAVGLQSWYRRRQAASTIKTLRLARASAVRIQSMARSNGAKARFARQVFALREAKASMFL